MQEELKSNNLRKKKRGMQIEKQVKEQLLRYFLVGGSSALFELVLFALLRRGLNINLQLSNILATATATGLNFLMNRSWSFKSTSNVGRNLVLYLTLIGFNLFFTTYALTVFVSWGVLDILAKFALMGAVTLWNFILYRKVVFK